MSCQVRVSTEGPIYYCWEVEIISPPLHSCEVESHTNKPKNTTKGSKLGFFLKQLANQNDIMNG